MRRGDSGDLPLVVNRSWMLMARPRKFALPQQAGTNTPTLTVSWEAADPSIYEAKENEISMTLGTRHRAQVLNRGCRRTWLRVRILGPVTNPVVLNETTQERLQVQIRMSAGNVLDLDFFEGSIVLNENPMGYREMITRDSSYWSLAPGSTFVQVTGSDTTLETRATLWWRSAW
jgi:hypothetical protein